MIYTKYIKRFLDFILSFFILLLLSPLLFILAIIGAIKMKGNPFFVQARPGKNGEIFHLIKLRTMSNERDADGNLLPDEQRLNSYGKLLRSTSLDELPELINIVKGDCSFVGPRPLAVQYLPYYTEEEFHRHDVRPGLTGLAQVKGRNRLNWEERFEQDLYYVNHCSLWLDLKIFFLTFVTVFKRENIGTRGVDAPMDFDEYRKKEWEKCHVSKG